MQQHGRIRAEGRDGAQTLMPEAPDRQRDDVLRRKVAVAGFQRCGFDGRLFVRAKRL